MRDLLDLDRLGEAHPPLLLWHGGLVVVACGGRLVGLDLGFELGRGLLALALALVGGLALALGRGFPPTRRRVKEVAEHDARHVEVALLLLVVVVAAVAAADAAHRRKEVDSAVALAVEVVEVVLVVREGLAPQALGHLVLALVGVAVELGEREEVVVDGRSGTRGRTVRAGV